VNINGHQIDLSSQLSTQEEEDNLSVLDKSIIIPGTLSYLSTSTNLKEESKPIHSKILKRITSGLPVIIFQHIGIKSHNILVK